MLKRPWFTRASVFQELVLSEDMHVFIGPFAFPLRTFLAAISGTVEVQLRQAGVIEARVPFGYPALERMMKNVDERLGTSISETFLYFLKNWLSHKSLRFSGLCICLPESFGEFPVQV